MKRLQVQAKRTDTYEISIDPVVVDRAYLADYSKHFNRIDTIEELAEDLAAQLIRFGSNNFFEGFGYVKTFNRSGSELTQYKNGRAVLQDELAEGISINIISEDEEYEFDTYEIVKSLDS